MTKRFYVSQTPGDPGGHSVIDRARKNQWGERLAVACYLPLAEAESLAADLNEQHGPKEIGEYSYRGFRIVLIDHGPYNPVASKVRFSTVVYEHDEKVDGIGISGSALKVLRETILIIHDRHYRKGDKVLIVKGHFKGVVGTCGANMERGHVLVNYVWRGMPMASILYFESLEPAPC